MPMKLNVGLSKKVGQPDYGSLGANCHLEVELEADLLRQPDDLHEKIRYLFRLARESVEEELKGKAGANGQPYHSNGNGTRNGRQATQSQVRAIQAIADRQRIDLPQLLQSRFGASCPDDLSVRDASGLIDELKASSNGGRR